MKGHRGRTRGTELGKDRDERDEGRRMTSRCEEGLIDGPDKTRENPRQNRSQDERIVD